MSIGAPRKPVDFAFWLACHGLDRELVHVLLAEHLDDVGIAWDGRRIEAAVRLAMHRVARAAAPPDRLLAAEELIDVVALQHYRELGKLAEHYGPRWAQLCQWLDEYSTEQIRERLATAYGFKRRDDEAA